jgi:hypothetical protein
MINKKPAVLILFPMIWLCSCTHYYSVASVQNVPLFKEKKELRLSGAYAFGDKSESIEIQSAYSNVFNKQELEFIEQPHLSIGLNYTFSFRNKE